MSIGALKSGIAKLQFYGLEFLDNCIFYGGKLAGRFIFPVLLIKDSQFYLNQKSYFPECQRKSKFRIVLDQLIYIMRTGEINRDYFLYGFDRKTKNDFKNYVPWLTFTHARNTLNERAEIQYDPYNYVCMLRDKFVFEAYCKRVNLNTPENIGFINEGQLFLIKENKFFPVKEITNLKLEAFCKRKVSYGGGMTDDVLKVRIDDGKIIINKDIEKSAEEFIAMLDDDHWILQKPIVNQDPEYSKFHPHSVNTMRIITAKKGTVIKVLFASFRMGVGGSMVDNWSSGGISIGINTEEGTLKKYGLYNPQFGTKAEIHPDTGIVFEGYKLPYWEEILHYLKHAHHLFYGFHSIGWDVAITTDGIILIEGNDNWNTSSAQRYKGAKKVFNEYFKL